MGSSVTPGDGDCWTTPLQGEGLGTVAVTTDPPGLGSRCRGMRSAERNSVCSFDPLQWFVWKIPGLRRVVLIPFYPSPQCKPPNLLILLCQEELSSGLQGPLLTTSKHVFKPSRRNAWSLILSYDLASRPSDSIAATSSVVLRVYVLQHWHDSIFAENADYYNLLSWDLRLT